MVQQYNVGVQQQLTRQMGFELGYVGSRGSNIPIFIEVNPTERACHRFNSSRRQCI